MVVDQLADDEVDRLFHALADPTRRDIIRRSLTDVSSVSALARNYPISLTAVQKHVDVLQAAGLVVKARQGREQQVLAQPEALGRAQQLLDTYEQLWRDRVDRITELLTEAPTTEDDQGDTA